MQSSLDSLVKERCSFWPTELLQSTRQEEWGFKVRILQVQASKTINRRRSTQTSHHFSLQCCLARFVSGQYVKNPSYPAVWPHPPSAENSQFLPAWLASIICKTSPRVKMTAQFWLSPKAAQDAARSRRSTAVPPTSWYGDGLGVILSRNDGLRMGLVCTLCSLEHWSDCFILVADHCWLQLSKTSTHPDLSRRRSQDAFTMAQDRKSW